MTIKCGHCSTYSRPVYHSSTRDVWFCSQGQRGAMVAQSATSAPLPTFCTVCGRTKTTATDKTLDATGICHECTARQARPTDWTFMTPLAMVKNIKDGRYAVRPDASTPYTFIRVTRPKRGKRAGCLVIQTQHSERFMDAVVVKPDDTCWVYKRDIDHSLLLVAADPMTGAMKYGRVLDRCSSCGKKLTDDRSRYYSIGPECEKSWPEIIDEVDEEQGPWYPGKEWQE